MAMQGGLVYREAGLPVLLATLESAGCHYQLTAEGWPSLWSSQTGLEMLECCLQSQVVWCSSASLLAAVSLGADELM